MSAVSAPFGFRPAYHPSGLDRARKYVITGGYATSIFQGTPVTLDTNGTIIIAVAGANDFFGVANGFEFVDTTGKPTVSSFWPAGQTILAGTVATAWVWDDPAVVFEVQANGSIAQTAIGDQTVIVNAGAGSALTGLSTSGVSSTLSGAGVQGQWRIVGFGQGVDNAPGDAFTIVQVQMARSQFVANKVGI